MLITLLNGIIGPHWLRFLIISGCKNDITNQETAAVVDEYQLVWSDEFDTDGLPD